MVKTLIIIALLSLGACAGYNPPQIVEVQMPVLYCPAPTELVKPIYDTSFLITSDQGDYEKIAKSYVLTLIRMDTYIQALELQLESYKGLDNGITDK